MGMPYKEGKNQDLRRGSNFVLYDFWVSDILHVSNVENTPYKTTETFKNHRAYKRPRLNGFCYLAGVKGEQGI